MGRVGLTARVLTVPTIFDIPGANAGFQANCGGQHTPITKMYLYHDVHDQRRRPEMWTASSIATARPESKLSTGATDLVNT